MNTPTVLLAIIFLCICACRNPLPPGPDEDPPKEEIPQAGGEVMVSDVKVTGEPGKYTFNVTLRSPDTGCEQYADWWEVFLPDSSLIYRRILAHSHVNEQPFSRSGGPVQIQEDDFVYVRGHMNNLGYGKRVFSGRISEGLTADTLDTGYAVGLLSTNPLPQKCDF